MNRTACCVVQRFFVDEPCVRCVACDANMRLCPFLRDSTHSSRRRGPGARSGGGVAAVRSPVRATDCLPVCLVSPAPLTCSRQPESDKTRFQFESAVTLLTIKLKNRVLSSQAKGQGSSRNPASRLSTSTSLSVTTALKRIVTATRGTHNPN